jgi:hypothetical protein
MDRQAESAPIEALEELYHRRYHDFLRLALALVCTGDIAADVVQLVRLGAAVAGRLPRRRLPRRLGVAHRPHRRTRHPCLEAEAISDSWR